MNPSHGLSWEKSGEQEGVFATLFILTGKLDQVDSNIADTGWQSVTFNSEYQKNIGSISSITNGKITNYKQIKSVDLITTAHINVNVASNNNLYLHPSNSSELTDTFEYRLRIHY